MFNGPIGLATESPFGPRASKGDPYWKSDRNNFGPRAGLVVDLTGKGKTILRVGGGISYAPPQPLFYYDGTWIDPKVPFITTIATTDLPSTALPVTFPFPDSFVEDIRNDPSKFRPDWSWASRHPISAVETNTPGNGTCRSSILLQTRWRCRPHMLAAER